MLLNYTSAKEKGYFNSSWFSSSWVLIPLIRMAIFSVFNHPRRLPYLLFSGRSLAYPLHLSSTHPLQLQHLHPPPLHSLSPVARGSAVARISFSISLLLDPLLPLGHGVHHPLPQATLPGWTAAELHRTLQHRGIPFNHSASKSTLFWLISLTQPQHSCAAWPSDHQCPTPSIQPYPAHRSTSTSVFSGDITALAPAGSEPVPSAPPGGSQVKSPLLLYPFYLYLLHLNPPMLIQLLNLRPVRPHSFPLHMHPFIPLSLFLPPHLFLNPFRLLFHSPFASTFKHLNHLHLPFLYHL